MICERADKTDIPDIDKKKCVRRRRSRRGRHAPRARPSSLVIKPTRRELICSSHRPDRRAARSRRYLVPADLTVGQFVYVIRKRIKLSPEKAIFIFVGNVLPPTAAMMSSVYEQNKDDDGFLYITYSGENTFGEDVLEAMPEL